MTKAIFRALAIVATLFLGTSLPPARAADPIKIGFSIALTGGTAGSASKSWPRCKSGATSQCQRRADRPAGRARLLRRPKQPGDGSVSIPSCSNIDKVDLLIGPYSTNMVAPAIPMLIERKPHDLRHPGERRQQPIPLRPLFLDDPYGTGSRECFSTGFFELARHRTRSPRPWRSSARRRIRPQRDSTARRPISRLPVPDRLRPELSADAPPISRRSSARCRRTTPTSSMSPPIRPTRSASCARRARSASRRKWSAAP